MLTINIDKAQLKQLRQSIDGLNKTLPKEIKIAVNATAKKTQTIISRHIQKELAVTNKAVKDLIHTRSRISGNYPFAQVILKKTARFSLKRFKPNQINSGVSYRISKKTGRNRVAGAFMGPSKGKIAPKLGGHVFKRSGKNRTPIVKLHGPSPWGVFKVQNMQLPTENESRIELRKQIDRRIRQAIRKKQGKF